MEETKQEEGKSEEKKKESKELKEEKMLAEKKKEPEVYPAEEQGILPKETSEEKEAEMEHGEKDEDIYTDEGREKQEEDAEIDTWEEGFMEGATDAGQLGKDALTGEPLMDVEDVYEAVIGGKTYRFVKEENAKKFREKMEKE